MEFNQYLKKYGLKESHIYLLELIPLVEMIWADGINQDEEVKLLYRFTIEHLSNISNTAEGIEVISQDDVDLFFNKFVHNRPSKEMVQELRILCYEKMDKTSENTTQKKTKQAMMEYCLDIAAACVGSYPYKYNERIAAQEKALIKSLIQNLNF